MANTVYALPHDFDPFRSVVDGLIQGHQVANMIRRAALEQEHMARQAYQQDRENQLEDMSTRQKLMSAGRPISAGAVTESADVPGVLGSIDTLRKADPSRTVKYKTRDGEELQYELKTPEEQAHQHMQQTISEQMLEGDLKTKQAVNQQQTLLEKLGYSIEDPNHPGQSVRVMPQQIGETSKGLSDIYGLTHSKPKEKSIQSSHVVADDKGHQTQVVTYSDGTIEEKPLNALGKTKTAPASIQIAAASGTTEDDYRREGERYALTGVMPSIGQNALGKARITHYANEYARSRNLSPRDMALAQASFAGDKESLKKLQVQRDQIISFESTAQKNLDMFLSEASKLPDTGVPWVNAPLRNLNDKLVGAQYAPAINAARQVANNEIAKVTSGGGLGGVLSDTARKEVEAYNPKDATFKQTLEVARVLKQDMANRHESMDQMLGEIRNRIGTSGGGGSAAGGAGYTYTATGPDGHKIGSPDGKNWVDLSTGKPVK